MVRQRDSKKRPRPTQGSRFILTFARLQIFWTSVKAAVTSLLTYGAVLWQHNPLSVISQRQRRLCFVENYCEVMIKPRLKERVLDVFLSDYRRRQRLLNWVHSKCRNSGVADFSTSWQDGIALCALLESICPGVCPSYHLLTSHNRVKNCRLGLKLANKYLYVPMKRPLVYICPGVCPSYHLLTSHNRVKNCRLGLKLANKYLYVPMDLISPEEMSIAHKSSENKMIQYISMLRWASQNIKEKWSSLHESLIAAKTGKCFAKGSGLRNGIVSKRSKFTIVVSDTICVFNMLVEIRGPNNEYCGERLVSLHQAKGVLDKSFDANKTYSDTIKYLEDGAGNTFVRKKVPPRYTTDTSDLIHLDFQCGEEGTFYVTFVPRHAGLHNVAVKWQNHHVENSPFRIKVYKESNVSTKSLKGAQEKRVIYDSLSFTTYGSGSQDSLDNVDVRAEDAVAMETENKAKRSLAATAKSKAYGKGRQLTVTRRRMLRRIITRNGEDIVIEEAISPSTSRQSSFTENSDDDNRAHRKERGADHRVSNDVTMMSQSLDQSDAPVSLRTVPEEKQHSKEDNSTDSNKDFKTKTVPLKADPSKRPIPTITSVTFIRDEKDIQEKLQHEGAPQTPTKSNDVKETKRGIAEADKGTLVKETTTHANERPTENGHSQWFKTKETSSQRTKAPLTRTASVHKAPARRTKSDGPLLQLRRQQLSQIYGDKHVDTGSDISSDEKNSVTDDDGDLSSPPLKVIHSESLRKMCMYITDKPDSNQCQRSFDDNDVIFDTYDVNNASKAKLGATKSLPIMRKMWQKDGTGNDSWIPSKIGIGVNKMAASITLESILQGDCTRQTIVGHNTRASLDRLENIMTVDEDGNVSMSRYEYVGEPDIVRGRRKSQAEIHTEMCNAHGFVANIEYGMGENDQIDESITSGSGCIDDSGESGKDFDGEQPGNVDIADALKKEPGTFETAIKELECLTSVQKEPTRKHPNSKYAIVPVIDGKHVIKSRRNLVRQWTVFGNRSSSDSTSDSTTERKSRQKKVKSLETVASMESLSGLKFEFKPVLQGINMPSRSESVQERADDVFIVTPTAKVDKSTQVCEDEIKEETGWDMIERMYLLLRKISIKVPYNVSGNQEKVVTSTNADSSLRLSEDIRETATSGFDTHTLDALKKTEVVVSKGENVDSLEPRADSMYVRPEHDSNMAESKQDETTDVGPERDPKDSPSVWASQQDENTDVRHDGSVSLSNSKQDETTDEGPGHDSSMCNSKRDEMPSAAEKHERDPKQDDTTDKSRRRGSFGNLLRVDSWLEKNDLSLKNIRRASPLRQLTADTNDSGFDDNPVYNRQARFSLPSLRSVNGHVRLHRRPYRGQIPLDRKLVVSTSQSMSLERRELGHEADDERVQNSSSLELHNNNNNKQQRRRHRLRDRQESFSMSDSEINHQRRHTNKRKVFQNKRYPAHGGVGTTVKRRDRVPTQCISGEGVCEEIDQDMRAENLSGAFQNDANDEVDLGMSQLDWLGDRDENDTFDESVVPTSKRMKAQPVLSYKKSGSSSRSKSQSSIDSNYQGFGISKRGREVLMSQIGDFQNLCPTVENPDEEAMFLETSQSLGLENRVRDFAIFRANNQNETLDNAVEYDYDIVNEEEHGECIIDDEDDDDNDEIYLENRRRSLECMLSLHQRSCDTEHQNEGVCTPDTNLSLLSSESGSDASRDAPGHTESEIFDMFSSFDQSHLNDVLPRHNSTEHDDVDVDVTNENESLVGSRTVVKVAGVGHRYGQVGASNSFQVWIENPSAGSLSVNVIGPRPHTVTTTSIMYTGDNLYEVSYGVTQPGFYKIFIRWGSVEVPQCPYICEVTM